MAFTSSTYDSLKLSPFSHLYYTVRDAAGTSIRERSNPEQGGPTSMHANSEFFKDGNLGFFWEKQAVKSIVFPAAPWDMWLGPKLLSAVHGLTLHRTQLCPAAPPQHHSWSTSLKNGTSGLDMRIRWLKKLFGETFYYWTLDFKNHLLNKNNDIHQRCIFINFL